MSSVWYITYLCKAHNNEKRCNVAIQTSALQFPLLSGLRFLSTINTIVRSKTSIAEPFFNPIINQEGAFKHHHREDSHVFDMLRAGKYILRNWAKQTNLKWFDSYHVLSAFFMQSQTLLADSDTLVILKWGPKIFCTSNKIGDLDPKELPVFPMNCFVAHM